MSLDSIEISAVKDIALKGDDIGRQYAIAKLFHTCVPQLAQRIRLTTKMGDLTGRPYKVT